MQRHKHLLCFDLTGYGAALAIMNRFADGESVLDFEISPTGTEAHLILLFQDAISLQIVQAQSRSLFQPFILSGEAIENIHEDLLVTYLSQNKTALKKHICCFEMTRLSEGFSVAQKLLQSGVSLVDFRTVRTSPKNVILIATVDDTKEISDLGITSRHTWVSDIQPVLRSYFEIKK